MLNYAITYDNTAADPFPFTLTFDGAPVAHVRGWGDGNHVATHMVAVGSVACDHCGSAPAGGCCNAQTLDVSEDASDYAVPPTVVTTCALCLSVQPCYYDLSTHVCVDSAACCRRQDVQPPAPQAMLVAPTAPPASDLPARVPVAVAASGAEIPDNPRIYEATSREAALIILHRIARETRKRIDFGRAGAYSRFIPDSLALLYDNESASAWLFSTTADGRLAVLEAAAIWECCDVGRCHGHGRRVLLGRGSVEVRLCDTHQKEVAA